MCVSELVPCPPEYHGYMGTCYRYYPWVNRHYRSEEYKFQETWQSSLDQCEVENATLASIHSEEEAYWLKVIQTKQSHVYINDPTNIDLIHTCNKYMVLGSVAVAPQTNN